MFVRLLNISYFLSFYLVKPNIIQNGDFEAGEVDPWRCLASQCDASNKYLGKTFYCNRNNCKHFIFLM